MQNNQHTIKTVRLAKSILKEYLENEFYHKIKNKN